MQSAKAYRRRGKWLFHSDNRTTDGVWIASPPFLCSDEVPLNLGVCVNQTLSSSAEGVPHPTEWGNVFLPVLELAGVKSWSVFVKGAELVGIELIGDKITLTPHRNLGPKEGFDPIEDEKIELPAGAPVEELGVALSDVISWCAK